MRLDDENKISDIKSKHNFLLISNDECYELNRFINEYIDTINNKNDDIIHIYTTTELFYNSELNKEEQLSILKKIFNINEEDFPACIYLGDLNTNVCTTYPLDGVISKNINLIFKDTIKKIKFRKILLINNKLDNIYEDIFNKNYIKYTKKAYKKLKGNNTLEYYLNKYIIDREFLDCIEEIYNEIEILYKNTKNITYNTNQYLLNIEKNIDNENDMYDELDKFFDKRDQELIKINSLINDKQNLIEEKYKLMSLSQVNLYEADKHSIFSKLKNWTVDEEFISEDEEYELHDGDYEFDDEELKFNKNQSNKYNLNYKNYFENKSITMINTCQVTENLLRSELNLENEDIDFSVCASGYWKALEIELNIIFIDTIRKSKGIILEIPSQGISYKKGKYEVFSGYKYYNNNKVPQMVNINKLDKGKLCSCMLGELLHISQNYNNNELDKIIYGFYLMMEKDKYTPWNNLIIKENTDKNIKKNTNIEHDISIFMNSIVNETRSVVNRYRNKYSHTGLMTEEELLELKEILLKEDGLYHKISLLKKQVNVIK